MFILRQPLFLRTLAFLTVMVSASLAKPLIYTLSDQEPALRAGPGSEVAQNNCLSCHSGDYIETQPPKQGIKFWEGEVNKMIKNYHAPISESDAKIIIDYLANQY
jgi:mono/diheme cytochrome c family protein